MSGCVVFLLFGLIIEIVGAFASFVGNLFSSHDAAVSTPAAGSTKTTNRQFLGKLVLSAFDCKFYQNHRIISYISRAGGDQIRGRFDVNLVAQTRIEYQAGYSQALCDRRMQGLLTAPYFFGQQDTVSKTPDEISVNCITGIFAIISYQSGETITIPLASGEIEPTYEVKDQLERAEASLQSLTRT